MFNKILKINMLSLLAFISYFSLPVKAWGQESVSENKLVQQVHEETFLVEAPPEEFDFSKKIIHIMLILSVMLVLLFIMSKMLKKVFTKRSLIANSQNSIKILDRRNLSQKGMLYLVEVAGKGFLIGESTSAGLENLGTVSLELLDDEEDVVDANKAPKGFKKIMERMEKKTTV